MSQSVFRGSVAALVLVFACQTGRADQGADAVVNKAIKALGGEENLSKIKAYSSKSKGTINVMGMESPFSATVIVQGPDHSKQEFQAEFGGMQVKGFAILAGDKGWRGFAGNNMDLDADGVAEAKRGQYLQIIPMTMVQLKGKGFKVESAASEKVGDKTAAGLKITGPDGKTFNLYCDETTGLPVKMVAQVKGFSGEDVTQTVVYSDYKDFAGIKKSTKVEAKRNGEKFQDMTLTEFKVLDSVDPKTFAEPKD